MSGDVTAQLQLQNRAVFDHRKRATSNLPHKVTFRQNRNYESGLVLLCHKRNRAAGRRGVD